MNLLKRISSFLRPLSSVLLIVFAFLLVANFASAQGLVKCGNPGQPECNLCSLMELGKNLINFLMETGFALGALFITWGAFVIMTAGGSEERVKEGRKIVTTVVIGIAIMLSSWIILGTVLQILTGSPSKLPWTEIKCKY